MYYSVCPQYRILSCISAYTVIEGTFIADQCNGVSMNKISKIIQSLAIARICVPPIVASDCKIEIVGSMLIGRTTNRDSLWLVELLIVRLLDTQSHTTGGAITCDWWYDHTRLVLRPCKTCLRLVIAALKFWTWPSIFLRLIFARTITHDHYDQWHVFSTIWQQFQHFSGRNLAGLVWLWLS